jgi:hypothetical protein
MVPSELIAAVKNTTPLVGSAEPGTRFSGFIPDSVFGTLCATASPDIQTGDRVQLQTGEWVTVTRVGKSMSPGDTMLVDWEGKAGAGWGRLFPDEQVSVQRRREG